MSISQYFNFEQNLQIICKKLISSTLVSRKHRKPKYHKNLLASFWFLTIWSWLPVFCWYYLVSSESRILKKNWFWIKKPSAFYSKHQVIWVWYTRVYQLLSQNIYSKGHKVYFNNHKNKVIPQVVNFARPNKFLVKVIF